MIWSETKLVWLFRDLLHSECSSGDITVKPGRIRVTFSPLRRGSYRGEWAISITALRFIYVLLIRKELLTINTMITTYCIIVCYPMCPFRNIICSVSLSHTYPYSCIFIWTVTKEKLKLYWRQLNDLFAIYLHFSLKYYSKLQKLMHPH